MKNTEVLIPLIDELEGYIQHKDRRNNKISKSDIAWQMDHSLKVINLVIETTANSNPKEYKWKFNKWRLLLFTLNHIPKGKAKAPKMVRPPELISQNDLKEQIDLAYNNIEIIKHLDNNAYFTHFIFGQLDKQRTIKFLNMHTYHHLKIIKDILK